MIVKVSWNDRRCVIDLYISKHVFESIMCSLNKKINSKDMKSTFAKTENYFYKFVYSD